MDNKNVEPEVFIFPEVPAAAPHSDDHAGNMASQQTQDGRDERKVTFIVGGIPSRTPSPTSHLSQDPQVITMTNPLDGNPGWESPLHDSAKSQTAVAASSHAQHSEATLIVQALRETKQTTFTAMETMTTHVTTSESVATQGISLEVVSDKSDDKVLRTSDTIGEKSTLSKVNGQFEQVSPGSVIERKEEESKQETSDPMQTFEKHEKEFRDLFLSGSIMDLSVEKTLPPPTERKDSKSAGTPLQTVGLDHLDNLVRLMEQLSVLREENNRLRRRCSYLEDTKSLLQARAEMVETRLHQHHQESMHEHSSFSSHHRFFSHQQARAKSLISKQQAKIMHYLSAPSASHPSTHGSHSPSPRPSFDKLPSDGGVSDFRPTPTPSPEPVSPTPPMIHTRSQSVGSIEMVDLDLKIAVMELDTMSSSRTTRSTSKSSAFRRSDFKASKKLQEKWERVKKVFGGKPESGTSGSTTVSGTSAASANLIVEANTRQQGFRKKPPSLTHMSSVDGGSPILLDTLKPSDRAISKSNPQLSEVLPRTPSSTQSEPTCNLPSPCPDDGHNTEESDTIIDENKTSSSTPSTTKNEVFFPSEVVDETQQHVQERLNRISSSISSESSYDSDDAEVFQETTMSSPGKTTAKLPIHKEGRMPSDKNFLSVSPALPRRRSSPSLATLEGEHPEGAAPASPLSRSSSDKCPRGSVDTDPVRKESSSMPSTPVFSDSEEPRRSSPFRTPKKSKSAWGRVKNIIHTRRDSLKRKSYSPGRTDGESDRDSSPVPMTSEDERLPEVTTSQHKEIKGIISSPKSKTKPDRTSPIIFRKTIRSLVPYHRGASPDNRKNLSPSPQSPDRSSSPGADGKSIAQAMKSRSPADLVQIMGVSEEYQRKMQDWEVKKRRGLTKASSFAIDGDQLQEAQQAKDDITYSKAFIKKMEEWEQKKGLTGQTVKSHVASKDGSQTSPDHTTPRDRSPVPVFSEQEQLSESFSKRVQEWERVKTKKVRDGKTTSRSPEGRPSRSAYRSRSAERDRSASKIDKELKMKIEKKEQRIRRETIKLEKMKQKLESVTSSAAEIRGDHALPPDFLRKLHQWEEMKGLTSSASLGSTHAIDLSGQLGRTFSSRTPQSSDKRSLSRERILSDGAIQPLLSDQRESLLQQPRTREKPSSSDLTSSENASQDKNFERLKAELEDKEEEISFLRDDLSQLTERINDMNKEHTEEIGNYRRELWASSKMGRYTIESDLLSAQLRELELQVSYLQDYSQRLTKEKRHLHVRLQEQSKGESSTAKLTEELLHIQQALDLRAEAIKPGSAEGLSRLYKYLVKAQDQLKELQRGIQQRNDLLEDMQRHILVQEVTNKLLAADIQRRENDIIYLKDSRRHGIIRRWKTFHGNDYSSRGDGQMQSNRHLPQVKHHGSLHNSSSEIQQSLKNLSRQGFSLESLPQEWIQDARNQLIGKSKGLDMLETKHAAAQTSTDPSLISSMAKSVQTSLQDITLSDEKEGLDYSICSARTDVPQGAMEGRAWQQTASGEAIPRQQIDRLIRQYRTQDQSNTGSRQELTSHEASPDKSPASGRKAKLPGSSVYSEWLRRDFRQPRIEQRRTREPGEELEQVRHVGDLQSSDKGGSHGDSLFSFGTGSLESDSIVRPKSTELVYSFGSESKPPHSPGIRSRHPRKQRAAEARLQVQAAGSSPSWQAAQPKRNLRPVRQPSIDVASQDELLVPTKTSVATIGKSSPIDNVLRARTKSDGSITMSESIQSHPRITETKKYGSLDRGDESSSQLTGVRSLVNRFEQQTLGVSSVETRRKSPAPLTISPVRRLKTAKELLQDSASSQRSRSTSRDHRGWSPAREKLPSSSSDKENDKEQGRSNVQILMQKFLSEGDKGEQSSSVFAPRTNVKKDSPLKDRTNGMEIPGGSESGQLSSSISVTEDEDLHCRQRSNTHPGSKRPEQTQTETTSATTTPQLSPLSMRSSERAQSFNVPPQHGSSLEEFTTSPWQLQERKSGGKKKHVFGSPKGSQSKSTGRGAISALCMQTMSVSLESAGSDTPPSSPGGSKERKGRLRGRLLDANWLQKPRRFFKSSKTCSCCGCSNYLCAKDGNAHRPSVQD